MFAKTREWMAFLFMAALGLIMVASGCDDGDDSTGNTDLTKQAMYVDECGDAFEQCVSDCFDDGQGGEGEQYGEGDDGNEDGQQEDGQQDDGQQDGGGLPGQETGDARDIGLNSNGQSLCIDACQTTLDECTDDAAGEDETQEGCVGLFDTCVSTCENDFESCIDDGGGSGCQDALGLCVDVCVQQVDECAKQDPGYEGEDDNDEDVKVY